MSCDKKCVYCVNFIYKLMFNGYHGICDKKGELVRFTDKCDDFYPGKNKIYTQEERGAD